MEGDRGAPGSALGVQCAMSCLQSPECAGLAAALSIVVQCTLVVVITRLRQFPQLECLRGPSRAVSLVLEPIQGGFLCGHLHSPSRAVSLVLKCLYGPSEAVSLVLAFMARTGRFPWSALHVLPRSIA